MHRLVSKTTSLEPKLYVQFFAVTHKIMYCIHNLDLNSWHLLTVTSVSGLDQTPAQCQASVWTCPHQISNGSTWKKIDEIRENLKTILKKQAVENALYITWVIQDWQKFPLDMCRALSLTIVKLVHLASPLASFFFFKPSVYLNHHGNSTTV